MPVPVGRDQWIGLWLVLLMHGAALYGLWSYRLLPAPDQAVPLFVNLINPTHAPTPPVPFPVSPPKAQRISPRPSPAQPQQRLTTDAPLATADAPAVVPMPEPAIDAPPPGPPLSISAAVAQVAPLAPVEMTSDLSVGCPDRMPPGYPSLSRRLGEQGRVVLLVELDAVGRVAAARVKESSGFVRLDEAGLAAVRQWHCNPLSQHGEAVRAVAMQPFNFVLEGHR